ncbi:MAG: YhbY family RNA-binding protein [Gammaproteobacteria bacterium]|jgi:RNA-binding protein
MPLTEKQKKHLRRIGHTLEPVLLTGGAGMTPGLLAELDITLAHHELVKVRVRAGDRATRDAMIESMCEAAGAELVQRIGHVALLWRANPERRRVPLA